MCGKNGNKNVRKSDCAVNDVSDLESKCEETPQLVNSESEFDECFEEITVQ